MHRRQAIEAVRATCIQSRNSATAARAKVRCRDANCMAAADATFSYSRLHGKLTLRFHPLLRINGVDNYRVSRLEGKGSIALANGLVRPRKRRVPPGAHLILPYLRLILFKDALQIMPLAQGILYHQNSH